MVYEIPLYNWVVVHPLYNPTNQVFFDGSCDYMFFFGGAERGLPSEEAGGQTSAGRLPRCIRVFHGISGVATCGIPRMVSLQQTKHPQVSQHPQTKLPPKNIKEFHSEFPKTILVEQHLYIRKMSFQLSNLGGFWRRDFWDEFFFFKPSLQVDDFEDALGRLRPLFSEVSREDFRHQILPGPNFAQFKFWKKNTCAVQVGLQILMLN